MDRRISVLKENQQMLGDKINMLQETNRKKDEEADKIRELIAECRENLNRIKCEALNSNQKQENIGNTPCEERQISRPGGSEKRNKCPPEDRRTQYTGGRHDAPGGKSLISGQPQSFETPDGGKMDDPCGRSRAAAPPHHISNPKFPCGSKPHDPCAKYSNLTPHQPCEASKPDGSHNDPCGKFQSPGEDPCGDITNKAGASKGPCESRTSTLRTQISALADAQEKSRRCIEKLGERMEREVRMKVVQGNPGGCSQFDPCQCETDRYQERVTCKVDLSKMKVNIRGSPEDLKKLDAVQLINLLDKFQCQELVINTGDNDSHDFQGEVPVFYITHPGNLALIVGIVMVAFLVNANLCSARRGYRTKLLLNMLYLSSFAFHYGIVLWMSFIRGLTLSVGLPRELFNTVDNLILPKYFSICVFLSAITLYSFLATHCTAPCTSLPLPVIVQIIIESTTFLTELVAVCYIVPAILKLREVTDEFASEDDDCPASYTRNMEKLTKLNRTITILNTLTVMFMGSNMYYISSKLNIG